MEGNQMKMREALNNIGNAAAWVAENCNDQQTATYMNDIIAMIQAALSEPLRNCDVGTAEEQLERWQAFCDKYDNGCTGCPCNDGTGTLAHCFARWAQMPYAAKEGGAK